MDVKPNYTIYKIFSTIPNITDLYIGSTAKFTARKSHHKKSTFNKRSKAYHRKLYRFIRENGGWDNFKIEPIETLYVETRGEGLLREQYYIDLYKPTLNTNVKLLDLGNLH